MRQTFKKQIIKYDDMIKRMTITAGAALMLALTTAASPGKKDGKESITIISTTTAPGRDSTASTITTDSAATALVLSITGDNDHSARIVEVNGTEYLLQGGNAFQVEKFKKLNAEAVAHKVKKQMHDEILAYHDNNAWNENIVALMSIIFIVPCFTILILSGLLILFLTNKNKSRNDIISKAIDHNYPLPDSFYGVTPPSCDYQPSEGANATDLGSGKVNPSQRDPKKFSSAVTLIAGGVGLTLFLLLVGAGSVSCFGLVPLLMGIGQLVGYYYVPGFTTENLSTGRRYSYPSYDQYASRGNYRQPSGNVSASQDCPPPPPTGDQPNYNR